MDTKNKVIVFDLDDTIYKEIEFLKSGYKAIINKLAVDFSIELNLDNLLNYYNKGENVFKKILKQDISHKVTMEYLFDIYRNHVPNIILCPKNKIGLNKLKENGFILGLITDGRSITQRNKIKSLGLNNLFDVILISEEFGSEKPNENNYLHFVSKFPECQYYYIGDNVKKDFITPNKLGWKTIGMRDVDSVNIHSQKIVVPKEYHPQIWIDSIAGLNYLLRK